MKTFVVLCSLVVLAQGKVLPERLHNLLCRKSDPDYEKCARNNFDKSIKVLVKGIPELNLPPIDPLELPFASVNRTINELVSIKSVLKNIKVEGLSNVIIDHLRADPNDLSAEVRLSFPLARLQMDYDVTGQLLVVPLRSSGFMDGNFTDTQIFVKGNLKPIDKDGVKYFRMDKFYLKARVGDGVVKLTAANPDLQFGADLIANFYNGNPRVVMDAINPIFVETTSELYRVILDQVLASVPAKEWLPE